MRAKRWLNDLSASLRDSNRSRRQQQQRALIGSGHPNGRKLQSSVDSSYGDIGQNPNLKSLYCQAISRTYRFPSTLSEYVSVQEIMLETRLSFNIPELYIKLLIDQETRYIATLNSLAYTSERLQLTKKRHLEARQKLLEQYNEAIKGIVQHKQAHSFKTSVQKVDKCVEFAPTNLHLQRMRVRHADCIPASTADANDVLGSDGSGILDIVTFGAPAAQCLKFKQGGLLSLVNADKTKKDALSAVAIQDPERCEIQELPICLSEIHKEASTDIGTLKTMLEAGRDLQTVPVRTSMESVLSRLENNVDRILAILDNSALCKAISLLFNPSSGTRSASSLVTAAHSLISVSQAGWDEMKLSLKRKVTEILRDCRSMLAAADDLLSLNQNEQAPPTFGDILGNVAELKKRLLNATDIAMQGQAVHTMQTPQESIELVYRRDLVFSQTISACICGVATKLLSSLHDSALVESFVQHGMLIEFESLLSTYKNELGMLEDFIVGMYDLQKVSFSCQRAPEQAGNNLDHLLPTLHGTRHRLSVKFHIDPVIFDALPDSLKSGAVFKVVPTLFNVGINEEQTLADRIGDNSLQDSVNSLSLKTFEAYYKDTRKTSEHPEMLDRCMENLGNAVRSRKTKNVDILQYAAQACRLMNGVRFTSCKSAKDRTGMSVTLEQAQVLADHHGLAPESVNSVVALMRTEGTRLENTRKNVGVKKYAFTSIQLKTFPKRYRPPDGTYGKAEK